MKPDLGYRINWQAVADDCARQVYEHENLTQDPDFIPSPAAKSCGPQPTPAPQGWQSVGFLE